MIIFIDNSQIQSLIKRLGAFGETITATDILAGLAGDIKNKILLRTGSGVDYKGKKFAPYSASYKKSAEFKRVKAGDLVNLTLTGEMLNLMTQKIISASQATAMLYFSSVEARNKARWHNKEGAGKKKTIREFFNVSDSDYKSAINKYKKTIAKQKTIVGI